MSEEVVKEPVERNRRKTRRGTVVSKSGDKTIVVLVERRYHHKLYKKQLIARNKFHTHDEENKAVVGDFVEIQECRPLSRMKRWRLVKIIDTKAAAGEVK
ncbi:MAG: 30S ribosomal protein S17 [Kiritimatiellae bacterium]|jgi:small subunit ribosomal protein S17|nr:30S ribosomal protein S17 [Kiritimatiellia bacterium]MBO7299340.1 30S ribosomal protein S17 [Kiritimatiellia bacterium]MBQ2281411.1 30S ribosomal protein S17 [Kiritimatiellia bacterium]